MDSGDLDIDDWVQQMLQNEDPPGWLESFNWTGWDSIDADLLTEPPQNRNVDVEPQIPAKPQVQAQHRVQFAPQTSVDCKVHLEPRAIEIKPRPHTIHPSNAHLTRHIDKSKLILGYHRGREGNGELYRAVGYPRYVAHAIGMLTPSHTLVELPRHEPHSPLPKLGTTAAGYVAHEGWIYSAIGRVIAVTLTPKPVIWVHPIRGEQGHTFVPYQAAELGMCRYPDSWNWNAGWNILRRLPPVGSLASGLWRSPDGADHVGFGRVVMVQRRRIVWVQPVEGWK
ncbi:hypothetical protein BJX64DRAFT_286009 [Aspergillus heterothallicus]